ncbi:unnamed protein product [Rotaria sp. Silwood2]|nr:unnamed protein product [Rotaria sp. Silwood2]CAF3982724.1 unnamed protein product [Rotaria sp. Silwood2]
MAIVTKQLIAEESSGAIIRTINALNNRDLAMNNTLSPLFVGEIRLFAGLLPLPLPRLVCNGSHVSRTQYSFLYKIIRNSYGATDNETTFMLSDFRGRVPLGVDAFAMRMDYATNAGLVGGQAIHTLRVDQLPKHAHGSGSLTTSTAGEHYHTISDPGHDHGGYTNKAGSLSRHWAGGDLIFEMA